MSLPSLVAAVPFAAAVLVPALPARWSARAKLGLAAVTLALCVWLPGQVPPAAALLGGLAAVTGVIAAWTELDAERDRRRDAGFGIVLGAAILAAVTDGAGLAWAALLLGTAASVAGAALPRTRTGVDLALTGLVATMLAGGMALFGLVLLCFAARPILGPEAATSWSGLHDAAALLRPDLLDPAAACLLTGLAALAGLVPLHGWRLALPAARPAEAMLRGLLRNGALLLVIRVRDVLDAARLAGMDAVDPGPPIIAFGLASVVFAGLLLLRQRDPAARPALAATGAAGVAAVAIGLGDVAAATLQVAVLSLAETAVLAGTARGRSGVVLGGWLMLAGVPPLGTGATWTLVDAARTAPWLLLPLGLGLAGLGWAALSRRHAPLPPRATGSAALPAWLPLLLAGLAALVLPAPLLAWMQP